MVPVLHPDHCPTWEKHVSDDLFVSCVQFLHRRYLYGQSILATCTREQAWHAYDVEWEDRDVQQTSDVVRALRCKAGASIDKHSICDVEIRIRRMIDHGTPRSTRTSAEDIANYCRSWTRTPCTTCGWEDSIRAQTYVPHFA